MAYYTNPLGTEYPFAMDYEGYGYVPEAKPPPSPDPNWTDPDKENKDYVKKIQKMRIHEDFKGLQNEMFFLIEVLIESVELKEEIAESIDSSIKEEDLFKISVKFLNFPFWEIGDLFVEEGNTINKCDSSYLELFNAMFKTKELNRMSKTSKNSIEDNDREDSKQENKIEEEKVTIITENENVELVSDAKKPERKEPKRSKKMRKSKSSRGSKEGEKVEDTKEIVKEEKEKVKAIFIMDKGKNALVVMTGLNMISNLQEHSVIVQMTRCDVMEEETKVEKILGESSLRLPESFRLFVLSAVTSNTALPCVEHFTSSQQLLDINKQEVGTIRITVSLTCFGNAVENCIRETDENDAYEHTFCWRSFISKLKDSENNEEVRAVDPKLALHVLKTNDKIRPNKCDSTELLRHCIGWSMIKVDKDEERRALKKHVCDWFTIAKNVTPKTDTSCYSLKVSEIDDLDRLFRKQERLCRELKEKEDETSKSKKSLFERLEAVKIQTGIAELEVQNPFESLAQISSTNSKTSPEKEESFVEPTQNTSSKESLVNH